MIDTVLTVDERGLISEPISKRRKVVICTPTRKNPCAGYLDSLEKSVSALEAAGFDHGVVFTVGCPYISHACATMARKALNADADILVFIEDDMSWEPQGLIKLLQTEGDVIAGTYRFRQDKEAYMGTLFTDAKGNPIVRPDGCISAQWVPAGFLKVTTGAIDKIMRQHPELVYGPRYCPSVDLFHHGAHEGLWYGQDYAFSQRWLSMGGHIWIVPDLNITHHDHLLDKVYLGNFHQYLLRQPGGSEDPAKLRAA